MFEDYLNAGMHLAKYELLEGDEGFFGSIPGAQGVWANEDTLEKCRDELRGALEDWVLFRIRQGFELPEFSGVRLPVPDLDHAEAVA
jgi:predicted RNase H-like HicB family nuclease